jgi:hypothetical protein
MKPLFKYRSLAVNIQEYPSGIDAFEVVEALNDLLSIIDAQTKVIEDLRKAYTDEVMKEWEGRPF